MTPALLLDRDTLGLALERVVACGNRFLGTPGEVAARAAIRELFERVGLERVREEPVPALAYVPGGASLVIDGDGELPAFGLQFTAAGEVSGPLVYLGRPGHVDDLAALEREGCQVAGHIAVIESFWPFGFVPWLVDRGALGVVVISENPDGQTGHYTARLYPPAEPPDFAGSPLPIPGVTIDATAGHRLLALAISGRRRVRLRHEATYRAIETANVVGEVGSREPAAQEESVVIGAHYDTQFVGVGACDNASGVAALVATAQAWRRQPSSRAAVFVAFAGEEHGFSGSIAFCRRHRELLRSTLLMANLDVPAWKGAWGRSLWIDSALEDVARALLAEVGWELDEVVDASVFPGSDHAPFIDAGVPAFWLWRFPPQHPYYHAAGDDLEMLDLGLVLDAAQAAAHVVRRVAEDPGYVRVPSRPAVRWLDFD